MAQSATQTSSAAEGQAEALKAVSNVTSQLLSSYEEALAESNKQLGIFVRLFPGLIEQFKSRTCVEERGHYYSTFFVLSRVYLC